MAAAIDSAGPERASIVLTYRYRLNPTKRQHAALKDALDHTRELYNAALEERIDAYRKEGLSRRFNDQCAGLTELRADADWATYSVSMQRWPLKMVDLAFRAFFDRVKGRAAKAGFPRFKGRDRFRAFGFTDRDGWRLARGRLSMKGIGAVGLHLHRSLPAAPKHCVVRRYGRTWVACLSVAVPVAAAGPVHGVGIDMGVAHVATLSTGEHIPNPRISGGRSRADRVVSRALNRCRRGSRRRKKLKARLSRLREREANARSTYLHQVSAYLTRRFGLIAVERLNLKSMTRSAKGTADAPGKNVRQKAGLNRSLADVALGRLRELLRYKAALRGGQVIEVDPRYTSQTCAVCGVIDAASRPSQARFACVACGHEAHADVNAAQIIALLGGVAVPGALNVGSLSHA